MASNSRNPPGNIQSHAHDTRSIKPESVRDAIFKAAQGCQISFHGITSSDSDNPNVMHRLPLLFDEPIRAAGKPLITLDDLRDDYEQFRVWARNLGVFAPGHASLDYRLRDANDLRDGFVSLLEGLNVELINCLQLLEDDRIEVQHHTQDDVDSSDESMTDSDDSMPLGSTLPSPTERTAYELQIRLKHVSDIVDKLIRLAEVIRATSSRRRITKATTFVHIQDGVNLTEEFETRYLPMLLKHRFNPKEHLLSRLIRSISLRRRRFAYQAQHQERLAYGGVLPKPGPLPPTPTRNLVETASVRAEQPPILPRKLVQVTSLLSTPTKATTFQNLPLKMPAPSRLMSASSKASTRLIDVPPAPPLPDRATHAQCPYCCVLVPREILGPRRWKSHVVADLQPYVCLEPDCLDPDVLLETEADWIEHQRWEHAIEWWCDGSDTQHEPLRCGTAKEYITHLRTDHKLDSSVPVDKLVATAGRPSVIPFSCCPFCDYRSESPSNLKLDPDALTNRIREQKELQKHITNHLLEMFLIALPERDDLQETKTDTDAAPGTRTTARALSEVSLDFSRMELAHEERVEDVAAGSTSPSLSVGQIEPVCDANFCDAMWRLVWDSPALEGCVREAYKGHEHDEVLQPFIPQSLPTKSDYHILWFSTRSNEHTMARGSFDEIHGIPSFGHGNYGYICGQIGQHNVVAAGPVLSTVGDKTQPHHVITHLSEKFPCIKVVLMVGVSDCGNLRGMLGDVAIGRPNGSNAAVIERRHGCSTERCISNSLPSGSEDAVRKAIELSFDLTEHALGLMHRLRSKQDSNYTTMPPSLDGRVTKVHCWPLVLTDQRSRDSMSRITSNRRAETLCYDSSLLGLHPRLPYVFIRGIDGSDSGDGPHLQLDAKGYAPADEEYAAAVAAAFAQRFVSCFPSTFSSTQHTAFEIARHAQILESLALSQVQTDESFHSIPNPHPGTSIWLQSSAKCRRWLDHKTPSSSFSNFSKVLWLCGSHGSGKSVLLKSITSCAEVWFPNVIILHFFFQKHGERPRRSKRDMYQSLLSQLLGKMPVLQDTLTETFVKSNVHLMEDLNLSILESLFKCAASKVNGCKLICFIDGLDRCDEFKEYPKDVFKLLMSTEALAFCTNRPESEFYMCLTTVAKTDGMTHSIDLDSYIDHLADVKKYLYDELQDLQPNSLFSASVMRTLDSVSYNSFLWATCVITFLRSCRTTYGLTAPVTMSGELPPSVNLLFEYLMVNKWSLNVSEFVKMLLRHDCIDVNIILSTGDTPLLDAVKRSDISMVRLLLKQKDVYVDDRQGNLRESPFVVAVERDDFNIVKCLLEHEHTAVGAFGSITNSYLALVRSVTNGSRKITQLLLSDAKIDVNADDDRGRTALFYAIRYRQNEIVQLLLAHDRINVNHQDIFGKTSLFWAVQTRNMEALTLILQHPKLAINHQDSQGHTALCRAIEAQWLEASVFLLKQPLIGVNTVTNIGEPALDIAIRLNYDSLVKELLSHPLIQVNRLDIGGRTPLVKAISADKEEIARLLIADARVDVNLKGTSYYHLGKLSPLDIARDRSNFVLAGLLLSRQDLHLDTYSLLISSLTTSPTRSLIDQMILDERSRRQALDGQEHLA